MSRADAISTVHSFYNSINTYLCNPPYIGISKYEHKDLIKNLCGKTKVFQSIKESRHKLWGESSDGSSSSRSSTSRSSTSRSSTSRSSTSRSSGRSTELHERMRAVDVHRNKVDRMLVRPAQKWLLVTLRSAFACTSAPVVKCTRVCSLLTAICNPTARGPHVFHVLHGRSCTEKSCSLCVQSFVFASKNNVVPLALPLVSSLPLFLTGATATAAASMMMRRSNTNRAMQHLKQRHCSKAQSLSLKPSLKGLLSWDLQMPSQRVRWRGKTLVQRMAFRPKHAFFASSTFTKFTPKWMARMRRSYKRRNGSL